MADLIKKIKIKKQDGTFTDYIPIGAEAINVSMNNGKSVQSTIGDIDVDNNGTINEQLLKKTIYFYNNIAEMKRDSQLKDSDRVYCFGYNNKGDKGQAFYLIKTTNDYQVDDFLSIKLDNNLYANIIINNNSVFMVDVSKVNHTNLSTLLNNNIMVLSDDYIPITQSIEITKNNVNIENMKFEGLDRTSGIDSFFMLHIKKSSYVKVNNCNFRYTCSNFIRLNGSYYTTISKCTFDNENHVLTHGVCILGGHHNTITENTFYECSGFNIQTLWTRHVTISDNRFYNSHVEDTYTATGGETSVVFNIKNRFYHGRWAVKKEDLQTGVTYSNATFDNDNCTLTLTFSDPLTAGTKLYYRGYKSLEMLNINAGTRDIVISGNLLSGTGDSGMVFASDYHERSLDPSKVASTDLPRRISVVNNTITDCAYAGIAFVHACPSATVTSNLITNCGWLANGLNPSSYSAGIFMPILKRSVIEDNVIGNIINDESYEEEEDGIMYYGIEIQALNSLPTDKSVEYQKERSCIKNNKFYNLKKYIFRSPTDLNTTNQPGMDIQGDYCYKTEINASIDSSLVWISTSGTVTRDETEKFWGQKTFKYTTGTVGDRFALIYPTNFKSQIDILKRAVVKISFWAKLDATSAQDDEKYCRLMVSNSNSSYFLNNSIATEYIKGTEWKQYTVSIFTLQYSSFTGLDSVFRGSANTTVYIGPITYEVIKLD